MGLEALCDAHYGGEVSEGKALLESDRLIFRGGFRLSIPFNQIQAVVAVDGKLRVTHAGDTTVFELGTAAERWAEKIRHPRGLLDKLGVKKNSRASILGVNDRGFLPELEKVPITVASGALSGKYALIFLGTEEPGDLEKLKRLVPYLESNGAIWAIYPKGKAHIKEADILVAGRQAGLVDIKVVSFSDTHTTLKFVIPKAQRKVKGT